MWTSSAEWTGPPFPQTQNAPGSREFRAVVLSAFGFIAFAGFGFRSFGFQVFGAFGFRGYFC